MKKKIYWVLGSLIGLFLLYIGLNIYQSNQMEIISIEDINTLEVAATEELTTETLITGTANLNRSESIALIERLVVEDNLYLIVHKWPTFRKKQTIEFTLENVSGLKHVNKLILISGDIYSGEGHEKGYFYNDLLTHPEQEIIWEKEGSHVKD